MDEVRPGSLVDEQALEVLHTSVACTKQPKVVVIACGGAGTNILRKAQEIRRKYHEDIPYHVVDCSQADLLTQLPCPTTIHKIGELGSGKNRELNRGAIEKYIRIKEKELIGLCGDITILLFSSAGGSGAVIAELLTEKLLQDPAKAVVHVTVFSDISKQDCMNTISSLKAMSQITKNDSCYVPVIPFYNPSNINGVHAYKDIEAVNAVAATKVTCLIDLMTNHQIAALDINDKVTALRPCRFKGSVSPNGHWQMDIGCSRNEIDMERGSEIHTILLSGYEPSEIDLLPNTFYPAKGGALKMVAVIGYPLESKMLLALKKAKERHDASRPNDSSVSVDEIF